MRCLLFLSLLLAIQTEFSVFAKIKGPIVMTGPSLGGRHYFGADNLGSDADRCVVKHNGVLYEFHPKSEHERIRHPPGTRCSFELIDVQAEDAGTWDIIYFGKTKNAGDATESDPDFDRYEFEVFGSEKPEKPATEETSATISKAEAESSKRVAKDVTIGGAMQFYGTGDEAKKCIAVHNDIQYEIYPNMNLTNAKREYYDHCSFTLNNINWAHAGRWTITGSYLEEDDKGVRSESVVDHSIIYELTVYKTVAVEPASNVIINSGYASFYLAKTLENATSCQVAKSRSDSYELHENRIDPKEGIELYKTCGVRMRYNQTRAGEWVLTQSQGDYQEIRAVFRIENARTDILRKTHRMVWQRGTPESLQVGTLHVHPMDIYCDVVRPDGSVILLSDKSCQYKLDAVSDNHAGVWKGRFGVRHSMKLIEETYIVEVWNPEAVEMSVSTEGNRITILCKTGMKSLDTCIFESPNGTLLSLQGAMGDGNYEYYGTGFTRESHDELPKKAECGLMIREPSSHDYGLWTCSMRKQTEIIRSRINVVNPKKKHLEGTVVSTSAVYVKRGDNFTIKCTSNAPLNYCWLQSPNGTMYSVTKSGSGGNLLRYNGEGLSMGVCGAVVENANDTDNGDWSCWLGVVGAAEVESIVPVTVTESKLIPRAQKITAHQGKSTVLSCRTFPSSDATIDYCRWVRPNGHGLHQDTVSRYVSQQDNTTCTLKLTDIIEEDIGTWMCLARLSTGSDEEIWSELELDTGIAQTSIVTNTALHIVAIVLVVTTLICGTFVIVVLYRRKKCRTPPPPPAYDINYAFPKDPEVKVIPNYNNIKNFENSFKK